MKGKKTIKVGSILEKVNHALKNPFFSEDEKKGMQGILETILNDTGNYSGYQELEGVRHYCMSRAVMDDVLDGQEERERQGGVR